MKLELRKFYKTRDGKRIVKIVAETDLGNYYGVYETEDGTPVPKIWFPSGRFGQSADASGPYDLVELIEAKVLC